MSLPIGTTIIDRVCGGSRNNIVLGSMFTGDCEQIKVDFLVVENPDKKQAVWRVDSGLKEVDEIVSPFRSVKYLVDQEQNQFIPVVFPDKYMGLFDCRSGTDILKGYETVEIVRSILEEDKSCRKDYFEWKPYQLRMALCKVAKAGKIGLIASICVDAADYGFNKKDFGTQTQLQVMMEIIYDSIIIDIEKEQIVAEKDGEKTTVPIS